MTSTTVGLYDLEHAGRDHRYVCNVCGARGEWARKSSVVHDGARHHLATDHAELGVQW